MNPLDPTFLLYGILGTILIFAAIAYFTRASWRRVAAALVSSLPIIFLVRQYDQIAASMGWWRYPAVTSGSAPIAWYITAALFYGAALGLVGWRVIRRWGWGGVVGFLLGYAAFGVARDYLYSASSGLIEFGPGLLPLLADGFAYASSAALVQALMYLIAGRPNSDRLARSRP